MDPTFETYAMRGLVVVLGACLGAFIWREIRGKDAMWKVVRDNKEAADKALKELQEKNDAALNELRKASETGLKEAREGFARALERITDQFRLSIESLNTAIAGLGTTVSNLNTTMAREYATKEDLRDFKVEVRESLNCHAENCPIRAKLEDKP